MKLLSGDNSELMDVSALKADGNNLVVVGTIMGAMPVEAVLTPTELRRGFALLNWRVIWLLIRMLFSK